jgi:hypothetical protein
VKIENNLNKLKEKKPDSKFLAFIVIVFLIVFFTARYATDEDFRTMIDVNILKKEVAESTLTTINIDLDSNPNIFAYDRYIAILSKNKLSEYTKEGQKIAELDTNISIPLVHTAGRYMVIAEKNGQKIYLISAGTILWETSVEGNISEVNVNENGYVSIIIKNTTYKSVIAFYDLTGAEIFRRYISNNYAICTAISNNNKYLAIGEIDYSGTILKSFVTIISVEKAQQDPKNSIVNTYESENGEIITNIRYQDKENAICMFTNYIQKVGISSNEKIYEITENDMFVDINLKDSIAVIDKQSSGLFSYEFEMLLKSTLSKAESLYILDSDLPKVVVASENNIALNLGNEIRIVNSNGRLVKKYKSNSQIKNLVIGDSIAGVVYKNKIEIIEL